MANEPMELTVEQQLQTSGKLMVSKANSITITTNEDYEEAGRFLVEIKTRMKQVKDYWAEPKKQAASAHKMICDKEKQMLTPLNTAEAMIKKSMVTYQAAVEKARREAEEAARKRQQEEADRLLAEALKAESNGDDQTAAINMAMAQMIDDMKPSQQFDKPVATGTSIRKTWKAEITNPKLVPAYVNGIEVREIKMSALNELAKMTNGTLEIPGVRFYQDSVLFART